MSLAFDEPNLDTLVRERIERWREGGAAPDAEAFLTDHPELRQAKSLVLDLILEEYCLRTEAGDAIPKSTFCERFPAYRQSVAKMLALHELLDQCPPLVQESERLHWPQPDDRFLGFDIVQQLGRGSLARVYLAREAALGGRTVVIKVSRYGTREAQTLGKLSHPHIVPIHSVRHDDKSGWTVICMPWLGAATAVDLLDAAFAKGGRPASGAVFAEVARETKKTSEKLPRLADADLRPWRGPYEDAVARLVLQLAEALAHAHSQGVLHRDIKPSNILLASSGKPMLLDFNLASDEQAPGERIGGTLPYMAPEVIASLLEDPGAAARHCDPRSDIYSLGAVFFELLAGRLPARPTNADQLPLDAYRPWLESKQSSTPSLATLIPGLDPRLSAIVQCCLCPNPEERYASAQELVSALRAYLGLSPALGRLLKRNRRRFVLGTLLSLAAGGGIAYYISTLPSRETHLLELGLSQYDRGSFQDALKTFDRCLELKSGWPEAHFARGQTHRQLKQWTEARADFMTLADTHPAWAYLFAGFCSLQAKEETEARSNYARAYRAGARDLGFLLNYIHVLQTAPSLVEVVTTATELLNHYPNNSDALQARALAKHELAANFQRLPPDEALEDLRLDCQMNTNLRAKLFESPFTAARVFAYAASLNEKYREEARALIRTALENGLPRELFEKKKSQFSPLTDAKIEELLAKAPRQEAGYLYGAFHCNEPLPSANLLSVLMGSP